MRHSILAARRQKAIEQIMQLASQLPSESSLDIVTIPKGNSEHRQLFMLERLAKFMETINTGDTSSVTALEILLMDGLSMKSRKAIEAYLGD